MLSEDVKQEINEGGWSPPNWEALYANIQKMRENRTAPVDSMGCERAHDKNASPAVQRCVPN